MPELPEVETVVRELRRKISGKKIAGLKILEPRIIRPQKIPWLAKKLRGQSVKQVSRRGKLIIIALSGNLYLLVHLKMTGVLAYNPSQNSRHTHLTISFQDKSRLHYSDVRKFGFVNAVDSAGLKKTLEERFKFGPEPLSPEFTPELLRARLAGRKSPLKALLLDQKFLAGLGNIYADESLFASGLHPLREAGGLSEKEIFRLHKAIQVILNKAIALGGSSARDYRRTSGRKGGYQKVFKVYQRTHAPCLVCSRPIKRIVVAGRGTHFCPTCQK